jgi:hypothetical protein
MKFSLSQLLDYNKIIRELSTGLSRLDFVDNFICSEVSVTIANGDEAKVRHGLAITPSRYILSFQRGNGLVTATGTWTSDFAYLTNNGPDEVTIKVLFFK